MEGADIVNVDHGFHIGRLVERRVATGWSVAATPTSQFHDEQAAIAKAFEHGKVIVGEVRDPGYEEQRGVGGRGP